MPDTKELNTTGAGAVVIRQSPETPTAKPANPPPSDPPPETFTNVQYYIGMNLVSALEIDALVARYYRFAELAAGLILPSILLVVALVSWGLQAPHLPEWVPWVFLLPTLALCFLSLERRPIDARGDRGRAKEAVTPVDDGSSWLLLTRWLKQAARSASRLEPVAPICLAAGIYLEFVLIQIQRNAGSFGIFDRDLWIIALGVTLATIATRGLLGIAWKRRDRYRSAVTNLLSGRWSARAAEKAAAEKQDANLAKVLKALTELKADVEKLSK